MCLHRVDMPVSVLVWRSSPAPRSGSRCWASGKEQRISAEPWTSPAAGTPGRPGTHTCWTSSAEWWSRWTGWQCPGCCRHRFHWLLEQCVNNQNTSPRQREGYCATLACYQFSKQRLFSKNKLIQTPYGYWQLIKIALVMTKFYSLTRTFCNDTVVGY